MENRKGQTVADFSFRLDDEKLYPFKKNVTRILGLRRYINLSPKKNNVIFKKEAWESVTKPIEELSSLDMETLLNIYYAIRSEEGNNSKKNDGYLSSFIRYIKGERNESNYNFWSLRAES